MVELNTRLGLIMVVGIRPAPMRSPATQKGHRMEHSETQDGKLVAQRQELGSSYVCIEGQRREPGLMHDRR